MLKNQRLNRRSKIHASHLLLPEIGQLRCRSYRPNPTKTVDGREVTRELIDGILNYDPGVRAAIVKLNPVSARDTTNAAVLGKILRTYKSGDWIFADVLPTKGYESILSNACCADCAFPDRSIETDVLEFDGQKRIWLEAVSLCGSERPALNLPPVQFCKHSTSRDEDRILKWMRQRNLPDTAERRQVNKRTRKYSLRAIGRRLCSIDSPRYVYFPPPTFVT